MKSRGFLRIWLGYKLGQLLDFVCRATNHRFCSQVGSMSYELLNRNHSDCVPYDLEWDYVDDDETWGNV